MRYFSALLGGSGVFILISTPEYLPLFEIAVRLGIGLLLFVIGLFSYPYTAQIDKELRRKRILAEEKNYENRIKTYLRMKGCYFVKYHGNAYSTNGTPDILACVNGQFIAIEVKAQSGHPSELQLAKISDIRNAGGLAYVVYPSGWNRLKDIIDGLLVGKEIREVGVILR